MDVISEIPIHVEGDMHDVTIAVPEPNAKEAKAMQQQMEQQQQQNPSSAPR